MEDKVCQYIVVDKSLGMSAGKMAAQVSHASMAFLTSMLRRDVCRDEKDNLLERNGKYYIDTTIEKDIFDGWVNDAFTKVILQAKNKANLKKVIEKAKANGLVEGKDYFCIRDACLTELTPDETGTCFTCIGFKPARKSAMKNVVGKLQVYKG